MRATAATVATALLALASCSDPNAGVPPVGTAIRVPLEHGGLLVVPRAAAFTDGLEVLEVESSEDLRITDIGVMGASPGFDVVGARLAFHEHGPVTIQYLAGFPPSDQSLGRVVAAVGATLHPYVKGALPPELLLSMKTNGSGVFHRQAIYIDYEQDGRSWRVVFPAQLTVCTADVAATTRKCMKLAGNNA